MVTSTRPNFHGLSLRDIDVLRRLLMERSVSRVAEHLGQSQPSVSATLRRLRDIFGDSLLVRSGQRLVLTDKGLVVLAQVENLVGGFVQLFESDDTFDPATTERTIYIAAASSFEFFLVPHLISELRRVAPLSTLELSVPTLLTGFETDLETGGLDAVVGNWPVPPPHLKHMPLATSELACMVSADHPLAGGTRLSLDDYLELDHISPSPRRDLSISPIDGMLARIGLERKVAVVVPDYAVIPRLLPGSPYAFTVGRRYAEHAARSGRVKSLVMPEELASMAFYLLWHERSQSSQYHQWLRGMIRGIVREKDVLAVPEIWADSGQP